MSSYSDEEIKKFKEAAYDEYCAYSHVRLQGAIDKLREFQETYRGLHPLQQKFEDDILEQPPDAREVELRKKWLYWVHKMPNKNKRTIQYKAEEGDGPPPNHSYVDMTQDARQSRQKTFAQKRALREEYEKGV